MDWKDIANDVAKIAPVLGGVVGGPAGAGIGSLLAAALGCANNPSDVQQALLTNPDAAVKLKEIESQVSLAQIASAAAQVQAVNQTIQADARGDSYWQKSHHSFECSFVVVMIAAIYVGLPAFAIPVPAVPESVWIMLGALLGVTAWQHGEVNKKIANQ